MTVKEQYTPEEWKALQQAPMAAGMLITMASPSITDSVKESMAVANKIAGAVKGGTADGLLGELLSELTDMAAFKQTRPDFEGRDLDAVRGQALDDVKQAAALADRTGADGASYKQFVYDVAVASAEAAKEGDMMGIGGVRVSDEEKAALAQLAEALDVQA